MSALKQTNNNNSCIEDEIVKILQGMENKKRLIAEAIAKKLNDTQNLASYIYFCERYSNRAIMKAFEMALKIPKEQVRVSRGAIFTYFVRFYDRDKK